MVPVSTGRRSHSREMTKTQGGAMKLLRRRFLGLAAGAAVLPAVARIARAETYPSRPVRIVVPFAAAGPNDIIARVLGRWLSERLGQPFVIENRPGAATNIGTEAVVNAAPDGHTVLVVSLPHAVNATLYEKLHFNFMRDIAPVAGIMRVSNVMVVAPAFPAGSVPEFISYAKANPGKLNFASSGIGASNHIAGELFKIMTGIDMAHVPYRSSGPADRSLWRSGPGDVRRDHVHDRAYQGGQAAPAGRDVGAALGPACGHAGHERFRARLRIEQLVRARHAKPHALGDRRQAQYRRQ
jgi:hypothetical protein